MKDPLPNQTRTFSLTSATIASALATAAVLGSTTTSFAQYESGWFSNWSGARSGVYGEPRVQRRIRPSYPKLVAAPKDDTKPQGPMVVLVSLDKQQLKIYDDRGLFVESAISSGTKDHPTPMGVFSLIQKSKWHRSNLYSSAPMPFMQRITWSGVALHAGQLPGYPASHGCVRLPAQFASRLWNWSKLGARVIITPGESSVTDVTHKSLAVSAPALVSGPAATEPIRTADATGTMPGPAPSDPKPNLPQPPHASSADLAGDRQSGLPAANRTPASDALAQSAAPAWMQNPKRGGQLAVFISRKDGRLYARQNFEPLFDVPVTIKGDAALGTHVFTARRASGADTGFAWSVTSLPMIIRTPASAKASRGPGGKARERDAHDAKTGIVHPSAAEMLDRIEIPDEALQRIAYHLVPGSSIVVSDQGYNAGGETGRGTEFIVPLR